MTKTKTQKLNANKNNKIVVITTSKNERSTSGKKPPRAPGGKGQQPTSFAAAAYSSGVRSMAPRVDRSGSSGSVRIKHRELVNTITGTDAFTVVGAFPLNPGMGSTFPWLSNQAKGWEQYRFHNLKFDYITRSSTSVSGSVMLSPDYDAVDPPPNTEVQASANRDAIEDAPWKDMTSILNVPSMFPMGPKKFVRTNTVALTDLKTYDAGTMYVCTVGTPASVLGKLWVEYDVEFYTPQGETTTLPSVNKNLVEILNITPQTLSQTSPLYVDPGIAVSNPVGAIIQGDKGILLPAGTYLAQASTLFAGAMAGAGEYHSYLDFYYGGNIVPNSAATFLCQMGSGITYPANMQSSLNNCVYLNTDGVTPLYIRGYNLGIAAAALASIGLTLLRMA